MARLSTQTAKEMAINWVKDNDPGLYKLAAKRYALQHGEPAIYNMSGAEEDEYAMGDIGSFFSTIADTVTKMAPAVIQYKTQSKVLKTQLKRAEMGLPPMQVEDYAPVIRVSPEFNPESEAALTRMAIDTTGSTLSRFGLPILLGVGGLVILVKLMRR